MEHVGPNFIDLDKTTVLLFRDKTITEPILLKMKICYKIFVMGLLRCAVVWCILVLQYLMPFCLKSKVDNQIRINNMGRICIVGRTLAAYLRLRCDKANRKRELVTINPGKLTLRELS